MAYPQPSTRDLEDALVDYDARIAKIEKEIHSLRNSTRYQNALTAIKYNPNKKEIYSEDRFGHFEAHDMIRGYEEEIMALNNERVELKAKRHRVLEELKHGYVPHTPQVSKRKSSAPRGPLRDSRTGRFVSRKW